MAKAALSDVRGPLNNLIDNLSGAHGSEWLDMLKRMLRKELVPKLFQTWKTISVFPAGALTEEEIRKVSRDVGFKFTYDWIASHVTPFLPPLPQMAVLDLVRVKVGDLGFTTYTTIREILDHAATLGLEPCPPQLMVSLRIMYMDQPEGELLYLATEPLPGSPSRGIKEPNKEPNSNIAFLENDNGNLEIGVSYEVYENRAEFNPGHEFVFVRPRT